MSAYDHSETIAFVTGTNKPRGIGRAIVASLLDAGARKVYATARATDQLDDLVASSPGRIVPIALDITDADSIRAAVAATGDVNLLVNNAGALTAADSQGDVADARLEMEVNYFGLMNLTREFAPVLKANGGGTVVNLLSIASHVSFPVAATYSASKAAAHSLTVAQRRELGGQGTHVIGVYPGPIDTAMADEIEMDKVAPSVVGDAIVAAVGTEVEEVFPDPTAQDLYRQWRSDPKAVEQAMKEMAESQA